MGRQISIWSVVLSNTQRFTTRRLIYPIWEVITFHSLRHDFLSLRNKFGGLKAIILISIFPNAAQIVDQIEKHVLGAKGNEAMVYRKSILDDCAMLSVAVCLLYFFRGNFTNKKAGCYYRKRFYVSFGTPTPSQSKLDCKSGVCPQSRNRRLVRFLCLSDPAKAPQSIYNRRREGFLQQT